MAMFIGISSFWEQRAVCLQRAQSKTVYGKLVANENPEASFGCPSKHLKSETPILQMKPWLHMHSLGSSITAVTTQRTHFGMSKLLSKSCLDGLRKRIFLILCAIGKGSVA